jgi:hypothetical protein
MAENRGKSEETAEYQRGHRVKPQVGDGVPSGKLKTGGSWRLSGREREREGHARNGAARQRERGEWGTEMTVLITELNEGEETAQREVNAERERENKWDEMGR